MKLVEMNSEDWNDISDLEEWREYVFTDGSRYLISKPEKVSVKRKPEGDSHKVIDASGVCHYVRSGWIAFRFKGQFGLK